MTVIECFGWGTALFVSGYFAGKGVECKTYYKGKAGVIPRGAWEDGMNIDDRQVHIVAHTGLMAKTIARMEEMTFGLAKVLFTEDRKG